MILDENHRVFNLTDSVQQHCAPLAQHGITYFKFTWLRADGHRVTLCNRPNWLNHFYTQGYHLKGSFDLLPNDISCGNYIWDHLPDETTGKAVMLDARQNFNFSHGLSLVKPGYWGKYVYEFAAQTGNHQMNQFYINNLNWLNHFTNAFHDKFEQAIRSKELILPIPTTYRAPTELDAFLKSDLRLPSYNLRRFYLTLPNNQRTYLTNRELACIHQLMDHATVAQGASNLNISPRTFESYLVNAKNRLQLQSTQELLNVTASAL